MIMVLSATLVLPHVPAEKRGLAAGMIFSGIGVGVIASASLVPRLATLGLPAAWIGLALLCLLLTIAAWPYWPHDTVKAGSMGRVPIDVKVLVLVGVYALNAFGIVPHSIYLVDMAARERGYGIGAGAGIWVVFGIGAVLGPMVLGRIGDAHGFRPVLRVMLLVEAFFVALPAIDGSLWALALSAFVMGACTVAVASVVLGRVRELVPDNAHGQRAVWSLATVAFALTQAGGAFVLSGVLGAIGRYAPLFAASATALLLAFAIKLFRKA
jgi:predicted MFS family arabinose efflux permease